MTREEAIEINKNLKEYMRISDKTSEHKFLEDNYIALEMAIKALEDKGHDRKKAKRFKNKYLKLKTAIGKIKAEIENADAESFKNPDYHRGLLFALDTIDKYIGDTE